MSVRAPRQDGGMHTADREVQLPEHIVMRRGGTHLTGD
jgi:hypothetical protein